MGDALGATDCGTIRLRGHRPWEAELGESGLRACELDLWPEVSDLFANPGAERAEDGGVTVGGSLVQKTDDFLQRQKWE